MSTAVTVIALYTLDVLVAVPVNLGVSPVLLALPLAVHSRRGENPSGGRRWVSWPRSRWATSAPCGSCRERLCGAKGQAAASYKDGTNLVCVLPDSLTSPQLTAAWENNLTQIAKGNADPDTFMQGIEAMTGACKSLCFRVG